MQDQLLVILSDFDPFLSQMQDLGLPLVILSDFSPISTNIQGLLPLVILSKLTPLLVIVRFKHIDKTTR